MATVVLVQLIIAGVGLVVIVAAVTTSNRRRRTAKSPTAPSAPSSAVVAGLLAHPPAPRRERLPGLRRGCRRGAKALGRTSVRAAGATQRGSVVAGASLRRTAARTGAGAHHLRGELAVWTARTLATGARGQRRVLRGIARTAASARRSWNEHAPELREELRRLMASDEPPAPRHRA